MKRVFIGIACCALLATSASAQTTSEDKTLMAKGRLKIWTGVALVAGGAVLMPVTTVHVNHGGNDATRLAGTAMIFGGGTLVWFGFQDQRTALRPNTAFAVIIGRQNGIQIARRW